MSEFARRWLLVAPLIAAACAPIPSTATDSACLAFAPITFSGTSDTPETIRQIRAHNAAWTALCGESVS